MYLCCKLIGMPETYKCNLCNGSGKIYALVSQHDDKREWVECPDCKGRKVIHQMTDEEERDYRADYW